MAVFTVHEPPPREGADEAAAADRFVFVRDGFSFWAFLFPVLWMAWRRLWLVLLLFLVLTAALQAALWAAGATSAVKIAVAFVVALLTGFEASSLRRWTLARRNWINHGVVVEKNAEAAERRFFDAWVARRARPAAAAAAAPAGHAPQPYRTAADPPEVIGLFPEPQPRPR